MWSRLGQPKTGLHDWPEGASLARVKYSATRAQDGSLMTQPKEHDSKKDKVAPSFEAVQQTNDQGSNEGDGQSGCLALITKAFFVLVATVLAGYVYVSVYERISFVRLDDKYDPKYGFDAGLREEYFSRKFPDFSDIERYLSNSTLLRSRPPSGNEVFYFDNDQNFYSWKRGREVEIGKWHASPSLQIIGLSGQWRVAIVYVFCMTFADRPQIAQQDSCYHVMSLRSLLARGRGTYHEIGKGDVFGLASRKAPFDLPTSQITIESLSATKSSERAN